MTFWGSTIDASKAKVYELPLDDSPLPPVTSEQSSPTESFPANTKTHPRPTAHLPGNNDEAEGEANKDISDTIRPITTPTPDEGLFSDIYNQGANQIWLSGAVSAIVILGILTCVYFWRRRVVRSSNYQSLPGEDVPMSAVPRDGVEDLPTIDSYNILGEVLDEDEDPDEESGLRARGLDDSSPGGRLGFYSGFLEDDEPLSAAKASYRDESDGAGHSRGASDHRSASPSAGRSSGSNRSRDSVEQLFRPDNLGI